MFDIYVCFGGFWCLLVLIVCCLYSLYTLLVGWLCWFSDCCLTAVFVVLFVFYLVVYIGLCNDLFVWIFYWLL